MQEPQGLPPTGIAEAQVQEPGNEKSNISRLREKLGDRADEVLEQMAGSLVNGIIWLEKKRFGPEGGQMTQLINFLGEFAQDMTTAAIKAVTFGMRPIEGSGPVQSTPETTQIKQPGTEEGPQT